MTSPSPQLPRNRGRRPPRAHERQWRDRNVDKNLEDAWLEALNSMESLTLISICEGHLTARPRTGRRYPHINLRLKQERLSHVVTNWNSVQAAIEACFSKHTDELQDVSADTELKRRSRVARNGEIVREDDFVVHLRSRVPRTTEDVEESMISWFERMVQFAQTLDRVIATHTQD